MKNLKRILPLFISFYFLLYMFPFPLDHLPFLTLIATLYTSGFDQIVFLTGDVFFNLKNITHVFNGSGDTVYEFVRVFTIAIVSFILSIVWYVAVNKRINYEKLFAFVTLYARYYVGLYMLYYGFAKVFDGQFSLPGYGKLEQKIGDSSPMGLLWTFMGASKAYSGIGGFLELLGGYLILFRRTKTVGALITLGVMFNVALMNFCYDVPVKLFSTHLLGILLLIVSPEIKQLYAFFVLHRPAQLLYEPFNGKYRTARIVIKSIIIWGITLLTIYQHVDYSRTYGSYAPVQPLDGCYTTRDFVCDNDTLDPLLTDTVRWKVFTISRGISNVKTMADSTERFWVQIDNKLQTVSFTSQNDPPEVWKLNYEDHGDEFTLTGLWKYRTISAAFSKKTYNDYRLTNRGFHWINESPYNR